MVNQEPIGEIVWKQLIDYIETHEPFFPVKIKRNLSEDALKIFQDILNLMLSKGILIPFKKKGVVYRVAYWVHSFKTRIKKGDRETLEIYMKGPEWEEFKDVVPLEILNDLPRQS